MRERERRGRTVNRRTEAGEREAMLGSGLVGRQRWERERPGRAVNKQTEAGERERG
jgi:hypothetical protein